MKLTLSNIKELKRKSDSPLTKRVCKGFREKGMVCFFERFGGFWADQEPELYKKMKALEKKYS